MHKLKSQYKTLSQECRLYNCQRPIIALTGGIASGKSAASQYFIGQGVPLIDADKLVKEIYQQESTMEFLKNLDPQFLTNDKINFKLLRESLFNNLNLKNIIEEYIYNKLPNQFNLNYEKLDFSTFDFLIYDIPLLYEKGISSLFDMNILVYAPREIQKARLMQRDNISEQLANKILDQQMDIEVKKEKASFIIENTASFNVLNAKTQQCLKEISTS